MNLSKPEGIAVVERLVRWADVVSENFSPRAMAKWGLSYERLREIKPDLVMVSSCLFGQTGPQRMYPGFGGQGSAIAGFNHLTGWPDREAIGPAGTITDSLSPRYVALLIAAALFHRERTGEGQYIDVSQIETGVYSLSEAIVRASARGEVMTRRGNRGRGRRAARDLSLRGDGPLDRDRGVLGRRVAAAVRGARRARAGARSALREPRRASRPRRRARRGARRARRASTRPAR